MESQRLYCSVLYTDLDKLKSTGTKEAAFFSFIKDHKEKTVNGYPVRPIASVRNTPTEKIDWILSKILSQVSPHVAAHLSNTEFLIQIFDELNLQNLENKVFVSLDVNKLYPSIPIQLGIENSMSCIKENWNKIDTFGLSLERIEKMLTFICYNYIIRYNNEFYKQVSGVQMGAHFAPSFAIIFMNHIEKTALSKLSFAPAIYKRYIDDWDQWNILIRF